MLHKSLFHKYHEIVLGKQNDNENYNCFATAARGTEAGEDFISTFSHFHLDKPSLHNKLRTIDSLNTKRKHK